MRAVNGQSKFCLDFVENPRCFDGGKETGGRSRVTVMRKLFVLAFASVSTAAVLAAPVRASSWEEARKVCLERYNDEARSGTVPNRMTKSRYLNQCQASYVRSAKLEDELEETLDQNAQPTGDAVDRNGQGGPELLPPRAAQAKPAMPARPTVPQPRFKPAD